MKIFAVDLRRAFCSRSFLLGAGGLCLCLVLSELATLRDVLSGELEIAGQPQYGAALCLQATQGNVFLSALPIAAALPYTSACAEDVQTHWLRFWLPRSGRSTYTRSRVAAAALSGGGVVCTGELAALGTYLLLTLRAAAGPAVDGAAQNAQMLTAAWTGKLLLSFLCGALFALTGLLAGAGTESRYMAWITPFVCCYLLVILTERYFPSLYVLDPAEWLSPGPAWQTGPLGAAVILSEFSAILALLCGAVLQQRLQDG